MLEKEGEASLTGRGRAVPVRIQVQLHRSTGSLLDLKDLAQLMYYM